MNMEKYVNIAVDFYGEVYQVSDLGNVKSLTRVVNNNGTFDVREGRVLKGSTNKYRRGERSVALCYEGIKKTFKVHYLVAISFPEICGEYFEGAEVDHKNGDPTDNRAANLHWVDRKGNMNNPLTKNKIKMFWDSDYGNKKKLEYAEKMKGDDNPAKNMTEEWRKKLSNAGKGRKHTEESRRKMSESMRERYLGAKSYKAKSVFYIDDEGNKKIFGGMREAERETGVSRGSIKFSIEHNTKCKKGMKWMYC